MTSGTTWKVKEREATLAYYSWQMSPSVQISCCTFKSTQAHTHTPTNQLTITSITHHLTLTFTAISRNITNIEALDWMVWRILGQVLVGIKWWWMPQKIEKNHSWPSDRLPTLLICRSFDCNLNLLPAKELDWGYEMHFACRAPWT